MWSRTVSALREAWSTIAPLGRTALLLALVCWFAGVRWGWRESLIISAALLALLVLSIPFTIGRLDLESTLRVEPSRVVVGERAAGALVLKNTGRRTARSFRVELPVGQALAVYSVSALAPGTQTDEYFMVPTNRRAIIPVGPLTTVQGDPLGLLRRKRTWSETYEIYVHPATIGLTTIAAGLLRDIEGQTTNQLSPSDVAFHTLRDYSPGDDRRHVHWRSSAKFGRLLVKQYNDTRRSHVAVVLSTDTDEYADADEFELAVSCAASLAGQALRDEQTLTVIAGRTQLPVVNRKVLFDRFSGIEGRSSAGGLDQALSIARTAAPDASVVAVCVGSRLEVPRIRSAARRLSPDATSIIVRADASAAQSYWNVGSSRFVNVPELNRLNRGLEAVL